jgi:hypothetical protein
MFRLAAALFVSGIVLAQDAALAKLKHELQLAREERSSEALRAEETKKKTGEWTAGVEGQSAARIARVHAALMNWIESRLPMGTGPLSIHSAAWQKNIDRELARAEIAKKDDPVSADSEPLDFGAVSVALTWKPELPDMLFITAGVAVPCGEDQAIYGYRFDANGWAQILRNHTTSDFGYGSLRLELSDADFQGRRLLLIHAGSVQCASSWMSTAYSVFRVSSDPATPPASLISAEHGFWMGNENDGLLFALKPDQVMMELLDSSIDVGIHNRTQIHRYSLADGTVKRIGPVAFQPQDFAEEWLTQPWAEMQSLSKPDTQKWHSKFDANFMPGEYSGVVPCSARPDRWSIALMVTHKGEQELKEPLEFHFLVRELGNYRFEMEAVSDSPFEGCTGEGWPSDKHPWLSLEQLKALP